MKVSVISPGLLTTIQDAGRQGYQAGGFSVSGCMDQDALYCANALVNNRLNEAVLEMQFLGGTFCFEEETFFALTGADLEPMLNGNRIANYCAVKAEKGDVLECHRAVSGRFAYLAVAGGFDIPKVLGSKSTNLKCKIGGFQGRALQAGDMIPLKRKTPRLLNAYLKEMVPVTYQQEITLRVIAGPQEAMFTEKGLQDFYQETYQVTEQSDRMGYRLDGIPVESRNGVDIISDGIVEGAIQVPPSGKPMILLADRQTTGGYAKIGTVISVDIPKLVQCMPGAQICFERIALNEAVILYRKREKRIAKFCRSIGYCQDNMGWFERKRHRN
ncbi:MAG: biotin-dependent carboxyltransferase family protein [Lachnospiraceae bacterium]|nr:biotin-dependent carboxyltransferase family protein [Lachnospiraceae bacterium]